MNFLFFSLRLLLLCAPPFLASGQHDSVKAFAGTEYQRGLGHQLLFGFHYRETWGTAVKAPVLRLSDAGLTPLKEGGSRETQNLWLKDELGRQWVIRSVNKDLTKALLNPFQRRFFSGIARDHASANHPYAPLVVPVLARAAGVIHSSPVLFYLADDPALGQYSERFANQLYMLEERPDESWSSFDTFLQSDNVVDTEKVIRKLLEDHENTVDVHQYLKGRFLDILIGDWSRHGDQYRWLEMKNNGEKVFVPVPRDRDHAFYKNDGIINNISKLLMPKMATFGNRAQVNALTTIGRDLDRLILENATAEDFRNAAAAVKAGITDEVIKTALLDLPAEVRDEVFAKWQEALINRRNDLLNTADAYYAILNREKYYTGTAREEIFRISRMNDSTRLEVINLRRNGTEERLFEEVYKDGETKSIHLLGLEDDDKFIISGDGSSAIRVYIVAGPGEDRVEYLPGASRRRITLDDSKESSFTELTVRELLKK